MISRVVQSDSNATVNKVNIASIKVIEADIMTVFEHQRLTPHDFLRVSDFHWLMAQEFSVFSIKRKQGQWQLKAGHYIGVILLPSGTTMEILPKLNQSTQNGDIGQTRQWVQNMLSDLTNSSNRTASKLPNTKNLGQFSSQLTPLPLTALPLSDWLIAQFLQRLIHYQPTKQYQAQIHNQAALQGRLLIKEQLRHNSMQPHKFVCEHSVLSEDMLSNRLIKSALQLLAPLLPKLSAPQYLQLWQQVPMLTHQERQRLESVYVRAKRELAIQPLRAQQLQAAQQLVDFAYWLLRQSNAATGNSIDPKNSFDPNLAQQRLCLLTDMNQAFEQWASQRIAAMFQQVSSVYKPSFQAQSVWLHDAEGQACLSIRPDLLIYETAMKHSASHADTHTDTLQGEDDTKEAPKLRVSGSYSHVIDIKWKHLANASAISASDAYQLTSYAQAYQARQCWLVYPVQGNERQPVVLKQQAYNDKSINTVDIHDIKNTDQNTNHAQLWLIPFNVLNGTINSDLLPASDVV